jgi:hypothetical protein
MLGTVRGKAHLNDYLSKTTSTDVTQLLKWKLNGTASLSISKPSDELPSPMSLSEFERDHDQDEFPQNGQLPVDNF